MKFANGEFADAELEPIDCLAILLKFFSISNWNNNQRFRFTI